MEVNKKQEFISLEVPMDVKEERKSFRCPQCKYVTDRKNNLKRHIITMHQESSKSLECCGVIFKSKALLRDHVSLFHRGGYCCQICGRNFCRKALLHRHLAVHSGQKDFSCSQCGYATSHKSNLERHQKVHFRCGEGALSLLDNSFDTEHRLFREHHIRGSNMRIYGQRKLCSSSNRHHLLPKRLEHTYHSRSKSQPITESHGSDNVITGHDKIKISGEEQICEDDGEITFNQKVPSETYEIKLPSETYINIAENSKRLAKNPYKCIFCSKYFKVQLNFLNHECVPRDRDQPTLPLTRSLGGKLGNHNQCVQETLLKNSETDTDKHPKSQKSTSIDSQSNKNRKRRAQESLSPSNFVPAKKTKTHRQHCTLGIDGSKYYHLSPGSPEFQKNPDSSDMSFLGLGQCKSKSMNKFDNFSEKSCTKFYRYPHQKFSNTPHFYPINPFQEGVKNLNFWRVW